MLHEFLNKEICGYMYIRGLDEGFLTPDEAARLIMEPREIRYFCGVKCERMERDARGRLVLYSANFWDGNESNFLEIHACYKA